MEVDIAMKDHQATRLAQNKLNLGDANDAKNSNSFDNSDT